MRTANPALNDKVFSNVRATGSDDVMTLDGTVNKCGLAILITMAAGYWSYAHPELAKFSMPLAILGFLIVLATTFKMHWAPITTPIYALVEGVFLGSISRVFDFQFPGIAFQAVSLTFGTLFALLFLYKSGLIKASENFKLGVFAATGGIMLVYVLSWILSFFGVQMSFLHGSSMLSIGISGFVVVIAALNLVLDFDFIENASERGNSPKYMEWYGAMGLLVTLVWLYLEIIRLLAKLQSRR